MRWVLIGLVLAVVGCVPEAKPVVKRVECRRVGSKPKLDGVLTDRTWAGGEIIDHFSATWAGHKARTATRAWLMWDESYLYFAADMEDSDLFALTKERNGQTWDDDVFELFFKPKADDKGYYEFQVNALGTHLELALPSRGAGGYRRFASQTKPAMESAVKLKGTLNDHNDKDTGWAVEGRIPWSVFRMTGGGPDVGDVWKFTLCRYDYSTAHEEPDLSSCAPLTRRDFHRYEDYIELVFVAGKD